MGSKEREFNPVKNFGFAARTLMKNSKDVRQTGLKNIKEQLLDPALDVDWNYIANKYDEMLSTDFAAYQQLAEMAGAFKEFMSPREFIKLLNNKDARGSIGKSNIKSLYKNLYRLTEGKRLSNTKSDIFKTIRKKNPNINPQELRRFFTKIEKPYYTRRLSLDAPDPVEFEE
tara:strand:- start:287 stop:802 length:516 start_codon:yes stop_codon:yes gene_type:complete